MLAVVDEARVLAGEAHAAWPESFNEMFAQATGAFANRAGGSRGALAGHGFQSAPVGVVAAGELNEGDAEP